MNDRFWRYVRKAGPDECWLWTGGFGRHGYGKFWIGGRTLGAHRVAYELEVGPIEPGMFVCHTCDTPPCVNPRHLWLGNNAANQADARAKGRTATGDRSPRRRYPERYDIQGDKHWTRRHPERLLRGDAHPARLRPETLARGERVNTAKLTADDVRAIRARHQFRKVTQQALADEYGVSLLTVSRILRRKSWTHI